MKNKTMANKGKYAFAFFLVILISIIFVSAFNFNSNIFLKHGGLKVTQEHPFLINGEWIRASELKIGNEINTIDGKRARIIGIKDINDKVDVYNLEVEKYSNFVLLNGLIVHNSNRPIKVPEISDDLRAKYASGEQRSLDEVYVMSDEDRIAYLESRSRKFTDEQREAILYAHYNLHTISEKARYLADFGIIDTDRSIILREGVAADWEDKINAVFNIPLFNEPNLKVIKSRQIELATETRNRVFKQLSSDPANLDANIKKLIDSGDVVSSDIIEEGGVYYYVLKLNTDNLQSSSGAKLHGIFEDPQIRIPVDNSGNPLLDITYFHASVNEQILRETQDKFNIVKANGAKPASTQAFNPLDMEQVSKRIYEKKNGAQLQMLSSEEKVHIVVDTNSFEDDLGIPTFQGMTQKPVITERVEEELRGLAGKKLKKEALGAVDNKDVLTLSTNPSDANFDPIYAGVMSRTRAQVADELRDIYEAARNDLLFLASKNRALGKKILLPNGDPAPIEYALINSPSGGPKEAADARLILYVFECAKAGKPTMLLTGDTLVKEMIKKFNSNQAALPPKTRLLVAGGIKDVVQSGR